MRCILSILILGMLAAAPAGADSLSSALDARARLGSAVWSRVLRIENDNPGRPYPARLHALVFELEGILWFYTDTNGTQSLSLHRGRLEQEKAALLPLLRDIEPGFRRFTDLTDRLPLVLPAARRELPHGCFVDSVAYYLARCAAGRPPEEASLLSYYFDTASGRKGHTVLLFRERGRRWIYDPLDEGFLHPLSPLVGNQPLAVAAAINPPGRGRRPDRVVCLPLQAREPGPPALDQPAVL